MNALENIERTLEEWGQNLRGGSSVSGMQPRDVLKAVLSSLEADRVEGLDHKIYAPNAYTVELHLNEEERSRMLPFLGREELEAAIQRYCQERKYQFRGPLALQVVDAGFTGLQASHGGATDAVDSTRHRTEGEHKVVVHSRFDVPQGWQPNAQPMTQATEMSPVQSMSPMQPITTTSDHDIDRRDIPSSSARVY